ncbi:MAG: hypothetical protein EXR99_12100 [Gemmataceae bacterium]|nr:hypothetical protein [Gemmataceae bacterium]
MNPQNPNLSNKSIWVAVAITVGIWGCSQNQGVSPAEKIKILESRCLQLEQDSLAISEMREQLAKTVALLEKKLENHVQVVQERNELRSLSDLRTGERDAAQLRGDMLKKGLQDLLEQDDAMTSTARQPVTRVSTGLPIPGKL